MPIAAWIATASTPTVERDARAVEDGAQEIAALRVGAEQKARVAAIEPERRKVGVEHVEARKVEGVLRRDERRGECGERDRPKQHRRDQLPGWPRTKDRARASEARAPSPLIAVPRG